MSTWTEVIAAFYIGGDAADPDMDILLSSIMGDPYGHINFGHLHEDDMASIKVPCGTEGPLMWEVNLGSHDDSFHRACVSVWGNLRDFTDILQIRTWFATVVNEFRAHGILYSAVCTASNGSMRLTLTHADIQGTK